MQEWKPVTARAKSALLYAAREALSRVPGTQQAKAAAAGADQSTISRILSEADEDRISIDRLLDVLHNLGHEIGIEVTPSLVRDPDRTIHVRSRLADPTTLGMSADGLARFGQYYGDGLLIAEDERVLAYAFATIIGALAKPETSNIATLELPRPQYYLENVTQVALSAAFPFEAAARHVLLMGASLFALIGMHTSSHVDAAIGLASGGTKTILAVVAPSVGAALEYLHDELVTARPNQPQYALSALSSFTQVVTATQNGDRIALSHRKLSQRTIEAGLFNDALSASAIEPGEA